MCDLLAPLPSGTVKLLRINKHGSLAVALSDIAISSQQYPLSGAQFTQSLTRLYITIQHPFPDTATELIVLDASEVTAAAD